MKSAVALLACSVAALAGPKAYEDENHPRRPGTPLEIVYEPYCCTLCQKEGRVEGEPKTVTMMRMPG